MGKEIKDTDLIGTFEHTSTYGPWRGIKNIIELYDDYTSLHTIYKNDSLIVKEVGQWKLYPQKKFGDRYNLNIKNFTFYIDHFTEDMAFTENGYMTAKKNIFGKVYIEVSIPHDPDGSPMKPRYKKIK